VKPYLAFLRGEFMSGLVYRAGFLFTVLGNIIYMGVAYFLWRNIYSSAATIHGLTFNDTFLYVALGSAVFILLKTYIDWEISYEIREGMIAVYLIKPVDYEISALFSSLGGMLTNLGAISLPTVFLLLVIFRVQVSLGPGLALFPLSLIIAFLISFFIDYSVGILTFYTESIWGLSITKEILISVLSGALIPLQFYPLAIQRILLVLPFQAIYYTPLMLVTQPQQGWMTALSMIGVQLLWAAVLFVLSRLLYNQAIKVLRISGG
jgi:ABC-2 type transport system permease protein